MAPETTFPDLKGKEVLHLKGEHLHENATATGFSILGSKVLTLTDSPAAYVYDGGGLLGEERRLRCTTAKDMQLMLDDQGSHLRICVEFGPKQRFDSTCRKGLMKSELSAAIDWYASLRTITLVTPIPLSAEYIWKDQPAEAEDLFLELSEKNGRIAITEIVPFEKPKRFIDVPKEHVTANNEDGFIFLNLNSSTPRGVLLGVKLHCSFASVRNAIAEKLGSEKPAPNMLVEKVKVAGLGKPRKMDCALLKDRIVLSETNTPSERTEVHLTDDSVRVAGSAKSLVLFAPRVGAIHLSDTSKAFSDLAIGHERLSVLARETLERGPYPGLSSSRPVSLHFGDSGWAVHGDGITAEGAFADTQCTGKSTATSATLRLKHGDQTLSLAFPPDLAEAVHAQLRARRLSAQNIESHDQAIAVLGLENDWFVSTIAGPALLLHVALTGALDKPALGHATEKSKGAEFALGLVSLRRHFDMVTHSLPAFVTSNDRERLGDQANEPELKAMEAQLRAVFAPFGRAVSEVVRIHAKLERIGDYSPENLQQDDYTFAALSMLGGVTINPLLAYSGAREAFNTYNSSTERLRVAEATADRIWASLMAEWDGFVSELLPILIYNVTEATFPIRSRFYSKAAGNLSHRLATLDVRRGYPIAPGSGLLRQDIVSYIKAAQGRVEYPVFTKF